MRRLLLVLAMVARGAAEDQACSVAGQAFNAASGEPLKKVQVMLRPASSADAPYYAMTNAAGQFAVGGSQAGALHAAGRAQRVRGDGIRREPAAGDAFARAGAAVEGRGGAVDPACRDRGPGAGRRRRAAVWRLRAGRALDLRAGPADPDAGGNRHHQRPGRVPAGGAAAGALLRERDGTARRPCPRWRRTTRRRITRARWMRGRRRRFR